jgi:hypothetical protein
MASTIASWARVDRARRKNEERWCSHFVSTSASRPTGALMAVRVAAPPRQRGAPPPPRRATSTRRGRRRPRRLRGADRVRPLTAGGGAAPARRDAVPTRTVRPTTFATWPPQTPRRPATADPAPRPNRSRAPRATSCRHEQCGRHYRRTARPATVDRGGTPRCPSGSAPTCATTQQMATPPPSRQLPDHQQGPRWRRRHAPTPVLPPL